MLEEDGRGVVLHRDKCIVCMEGPQFSTRAESVLYRTCGGDLIHMSVLPEGRARVHRFFFQDGSIERLKLVECFLVERFRGAAAVR